MHNIKRYVNRKLYDTTAKKYVTLNGISELIKAGKKISVIDNKSGDDLTSGIVSQILARDGQVKGNDLASRVLIQLLRKGPGTLVDYGKKYVSLWDRALTMADEEIDKLVDRLVKDKEISESEGSALKKDMTGRADDLKKWIGEKIDQRVDEILNVMNLVSKDQVAGLTGEIKALTKKVEKLEKLQALKAEENRKTALEKKAKAEEKKAAIKTTSLENEDDKSKVVNLIDDQADEKEMVMGSEG
jgi:polyhydroxyalkanoate synthesis repressor PhaR